MLMLCVVFLHRSVMARIFSALEEPCLCYETYMFRAGTEMS